MMQKKEEIVEQFVFWSKALERCDPDEMIKLYAHDAVLLPTMSARIRRNREEIRDYFEFFLGLKPSCELKESNVVIIGESAIHSGIYIFQLRAPVQETVPARFTLAYRREGERWYIIAHHSSLLPALA